MSTASSVPAAKAPSRGSKLLLLLVALAVAIGIIATTGSMAYAKQFEGKALPGTTIAGHDVSSLSAPEIAALLEAQGTGVTVTVDANGTVSEVSLEELGGTIDAEATAAKALERENSVTGVVSAALSGQREITPVVTVDSEVTRAFAKNLVPADEKSAVDAQVVKNEKSGEFEVVEAKLGKGVDPAEFVAAVENNAPKLTDFSVSQSFSEIQPALTTEKAQATVDAIDSLLKGTIVVTGPKDHRFEVSRADRLKFMSVKENDKGDNFEVAIDKDAISAYVDTMSNEFEVSPKDGIVEIDQDGKKREVAKAVDGLSVTNRDTVKDKVTSAISSGEDLSIAFETKEVKADVTERKVNTKDQASPKAPSKLPSYAPAEAKNGKKWIDVDLGKKTVTAYVGDTPVFGPVLIVDGAKGYETVTGEYTIYHRTRIQDMGCKPGYDYCTKDVQYNQFFYKGYALHAAPWRSSFGYSGSHGCINMTVADAKWMWEWAGYGVKVVSHH